MARTDKSNGVTQEQFYDGLSGLEIRLGTKIDVLMEYSRTCNEHNVAEMSRLNTKDIEQDRRLADTETKLDGVRNEHRILSAITAAAASAAAFFLKG